MARSELSKLSDRGVSALEMTWPQPEVMYEIRIDRTVEGTTSEERLQSYASFLLARVFPLVDELQARAGVRYWHFYNHEKVDLRVSIENEAQMDLVTAILEERHIAYSPPTPMPTYDDEGFGSAPWLPGSPAPVSGAVNFRPRGVAISAVAA